MSPDQSESLVIDASVAINFLGTGMAGRLFGMLDCPILMADRTFKEIQRHPLRGHDHGKELEDLLAAGHLSVKELDDVSKELFFDLTSADLTGGLDDGEAAAIALAASLGKSAVAVVDDRKARNLLLRRWPQQRVLYSIDLFTYDRIGRAVPRSQLAEAIYSALRHARMRVPAARRSWVNDLIGADRVKECPSLGTRA